MVAAAALLTANSGRSGEAASTLFSDSGIDGIVLNPSGEWAIAIVKKRDLYGLLIQRLGSGQVTSVFTSSVSIRSLNWISETTFFARLATNGSRSKFVGRIQDGDEGTSIAIDWIQAPGWLVDSLPLIEDELIWAVEHGGKSSAHRISLEEVTQYERKRQSGRNFEFGETLATIDGSVNRWIVDRKGVPRAVLREDDDQYVILVRPEGASSFREVYSFDPDEDEKVVYPQVLVADGQQLIVLAYNGNDTMGLFEFDLEVGQIGDAVYTRDDVDVTGVLFDYQNGELIAAAYEVGGESRYHYFESYADRHLAKVRRTFPEDRVVVASASTDRNVLVLWVSSPTNPGTHYFHNATTGATNPIGQVAQGLDLEKLVNVETVEVESEDGTRVEAFLALPNTREANGAPLIVMPHGGPIGVRDNKDYNPVVQYFASWGYAVLQVNYRGSSGYGLEFQEAGKKQWARGIEDDIDAAVEYAMGRGEVDATRICIVGGSYGGFSALASVIRHDQRYRCAASVNGATDIPLHFNFGECADSERCLKWMKTAIGNPVTEREALIEISPAYHVGEIDTPIFVVYGTEDRRVDPDHSHRLILMLETLGKQHEVLEIKGAGHSFTTREWHLVTSALRHYLSKYLFPTREFVRDPLGAREESLDYMGLPAISR